MFVAPGRPVTSLGHQEGRRVFWGAQIFWTVSNSFKLRPTHFSRGSEKFSGRGEAPLFLYSAVKSVKHDLLFYF